VARRSEAGHLLPQLPLPPLDVGNILLAIIEGVRGRAGPRAVYAPFSRFGMAPIVVMTPIALSNDVGAPLR